MINRETPRVIPAKKRYWTQDVGDQTVTFRFPFYAHAHTLISVLQDNRPKVKKGDNSQALEALGSMLPIAGATIGLCWWDVNRDMEAEWDKNPESLMEYGLLVVEELQEEDFTLPDILGLFKDITLILSKNLSPVAEAKATSDFTSPPQEGPTT